MNKKLVMLAILDGYGITDRKDGNAILAAKTPVMDMLRKEYPNTIIGASGEDVGLPDGQMGNSEVGHMNIGAGRIVWQSLTRVNVAVRKDELIKINPKLIEITKSDFKSVDSLFLYIFAGKGTKKNRNHHTQRHKKRLNQCKRNTKAEFQHIFCNNSKQRVGTMKISLYFCSRFLGDGC